MNKPRMTWADFCLNVLISSVVAFSVSVLMVNTLKDAVWTRFYFEEENWQAKVDSRLKKQIEDTAATLSSSENDLRQEIKGLDAKLSHYMSR